jgi:hypothetical protein
MSVDIIAFAQVVEVFRKEMLVLDVSVSVYEMKPGKGLVG